MRCSENTFPIALAGTGATASRVFSATSPEWTVCCPVSYTHLVPVDSRRVHFVGFRPYEDYRLLLRASTVHVYFTAPFALSAGLFESMSCGCLLVSSDTEPVREVVRHGENGFLCDFWDHDMLADMTAELLARSDAMGPVRAAARQSIVEEYNLKVQIPRHMDLLLSAYADWKKARQTS